MLLELGAYRSEDQGRHLARVGLLQIVNELAARGMCDPMLPSDNDTLGIIKATRMPLAALQAWRKQNIPSKPASFAQGQRLCPPASGERYV